MLTEYGLEPTNAKAVVPGDKFGKLTVIATGQIPGTYRYCAVCDCECGSPRRRYRIDALKRGVIIGCGCVRLERTTTHGNSKSIFYDRWKNIIDRCTNPKCKAYVNYGGRGIRVCDAWRNDFNQFLVDIPDGYFHGAHLDRIDNDGHYEPGNVRWVTAMQNFNNRRSARLIECWGRVQSLTEWANEVGIDRRIIHDRLRSGWPADKALSQPIRKGSKSGHPH
jgi:hypothetical protein